jgi:hypothetical protein
MISLITDLNDSTDTPWRHGELMQIQIRDCRDSILTRQLAREPNRNSIKPDPHYLI